MQKYTPSKFSSISLSARVKLIDRGMRLNFYPVTLYSGRV